MVAGHSAIPDYRADQGNSYSDLAALRLTLESKAKPKRIAFELDIRKKLVDETKTVPAYRRDLATSHCIWGDLMRVAGKLTDAETAHWQALSVHDKLSEEFPQVAEYRRDMAINLDNFASLLRRLEKSDEAESLYRRALILEAKLAGDFPAVPDYRRVWIKSLNNLGNLLILANKNDEAESTYRRAMEISEKLATDFPAVPAYRLESAAVRVSFGRALTARGKPDAALECFDKAIAVFTDALAKDPRLTIVRRYLCNTHRSRAEALIELTRYADAVPDWDQAVARRWCPAHYIRMQAPPRWPMPVITPVPSPRSRI